jgi:hypothetical protein
VLHITVATAGAEPPTLESDIRMTKAAVLYADKVRLCSAHYSTWIFALEQRDMTLEDMIKTTREVEEMIPHMSFSSKAEMLIALMQNRAARQSLESQNPTAHDLELRAGLKQVGEWQFEDLRKRHPTLDLEEAQLQLEPAVKSGVLEIHRFPVMEKENIGAAQMRGTFDESMKRIADEFTAVIVGAVSDRTTYPLFDDGPAQIVRAGIAVGDVKPTDTRIGQAKQSQLAAKVLSRLPLFEEASMKEILDIRRELESHTTRFRSAIMKYGDTIRNASWNEEFDHEAEELFHREIEPAVLDIEDAVKSTPALSSLMIRKVAGIPALGSSVLSFVVAGQAQLETITSAIMSAGVGVATAVYDAIVQHRKDRVTVEQNQLYFYHKAGQLIRDRAFEYRRT